MNKYLVIGFICALMVVPTLSVVAYNEEPRAKNVEFTHTVFAEECTATWCPNCPFGAEALKNIYDSGDYPFYYVALVNDKSSVAKDRNSHYALNLLGIYAFPTVYFDGGDTNYVGNGGSVGQTETDYRALIEQEGARKPKQPIVMDSYVTWAGDAKLTVTVNVTNNGKLPYLGRLRSYVTEIVSRWSDESGDPYHFALLDFAINKIVLLMPGKAKSFTKTFDGAAKHGNLTFADITADNIMVISTISHWIPHYRIGYKSDTYKQWYLAFFTDQATATVPS